MKIKYILLVTALIITQLIWAQHAGIGHAKIDTQLKLWLAQPQLLVKEQPQLFKNGPVSNPRIPVVFKSAHPNVTALITKVGGEVHTQLGTIYTAVIPLHAIVELTSNDVVLKMEASMKVKITNEKAKASTGASLVHTGMLPGGTAYTGKGVVVGIFDTGLDFRHKDFRKKTDNTQTRILAIWDQGVTGGTTPANYNYGSEWTNAQLNAALQNPNNINTHDVSGHGTHVTGSAAGLRGIAPDADIVFVKGLIDWASDSTIYQDTKSILDGLSYMKEKAAAAGKPCVVNLSVGYGIGTPHDGTSLVEQGMDFLVNNNPGFFVVVAMGNENGSDQHWGGFELTQDSVWTYMKRGMLYGVFNSASQDSTFISFSIDSVVTESINWNRLSTQKVVLQTEWFSLPTIKNTPGGIKFPAFFVNGDTAVMIHLLAADYDATRTEVRLFVTPIYSDFNDAYVVFPVTRVSFKGKGMVHAWWENHQVPYLDDASWAENRKEDARMRASDNFYTVNILAGGYKTIAVGATVNQASFINLSGQTILGQNYYEDSAGAFAHFSNLGPTTDGRKKPDIAVPGINVASSFSRDAQFPSMWVADPFTIVLSGTSMAAPMVSGAIALYLEKNQSATFQQVKTALTTNAIVDTFVTKFGAVPNNHFGYGKLDIYKAMGGMYHTGINGPKDQHQVGVYPNPTHANITFNTTAIDELVEIKVYDAGGRLMATIQQKALLINPVLDVQQWEKGIYFFHVKSEQYTSFGKFVVE
jgi:subtilisin family serine protease